MERELEIAYLLLAKEWVIQLQAMLAICYQLFSLNPLKVLLLKG